MVKSISGRNLLRGKMKLNGKNYDIIKLGVRFRVIDARTDRSIGTRGFRDFDEIRKEYPTAVISRV